MICNLVQPLLLLKEKLSHTEQESTRALSLKFRVPDLTSNIKSLTIAINYLSIMPKYDTDASLSNFMSSTIGIVPKYLRGDIKVKHVVHVWTIMKYAQTSALMQNEQV